MHRAGWGQHRSGCYVIAGGREGALARMRALRELGREGPSGRAGRRHQVDGVPRGNRGPEAANFFVDRGSTRFVRGGETRAHGPPGDVIRVVPFGRRSALHIV